MEKYLVSGAIVPKRDSTEIRVAEFDIPEAMLIDKNESQMYSISYKYLPLPEKIIENCSMSNELVECDKPEQDCEETVVKDSENYYQCMDCDTSFKRKALLISHTKKHKDTPPFFCNNCDDAFANEDDCLDHKENCCINELVIAKKPRLALNPKPQKCKRKKASSKHQYDCRHCSLSFKMVCARNDHERSIHKKMRPYSCEECGKTFYKKFNLTIHSFCHSSDRQHECSLCKKIVKSPVHLKKHMKLHSDKRPFECQSCDKVFKNRSGLKVHELMHTGDSTRYQCDQCDKSYPYRASLFLHQRKHTYQRPYQCSECEAAFFMKTHLTEHFRMHSGERPFQCQFCDSTYPRTDGLKKHLISHIRGGLEMDLEAVFYQAKLKANVKPKTPSTAKRKKIMSTENIPANNIIVLESENILPDSILENHQVFANLETEDSALIVVISGIGDGNTCNHTITKIASVNPVSIEADSISEVYADNLLMLSVDEPHSYEDSLKVNERLIEDLPVIVSSDVPVVCDTFTERDHFHLVDLADQVQCASVEVPYITNEPQINIINLPHVQEIPVVTPDQDYCEGVVSTRLDPVPDQEYCEGIVSTHIEPIPEDCNDVMLLSNDLTNLILNQDMPVINTTRTADVTVQPSMRVIVLNPQSPHPPQTPDNTDTPRPDKGKSHRKPLKKCCYCDMSYRYQAPLEAHEASHELQDRLRKVERYKVMEQDQQIPSDQNSESSTTDTFPLKCERCTLCFSFRSDLRRHMKQHSFKHPYACKECNQAFQQEVYLARHQCGHTAIVTPQT